MRRRQRRAKIMATLGPASSSKEVISAMFNAGADVFRLNMSHGTHKEKTSLYNNIREVEASYGRPIAVLVDLQGPKLRVGRISKGVDLKQGETYRFDLDEKSIGDATRAPLPHPEIINYLTPGATILVNDGKIRLRVCDNPQGALDCEILTGGLLTSNKGVNVPDHQLPLEALTEKDKKDLNFALNLGVDWIALSFVQCAEDIVHLRKISDDRVKIMAKIEKPKAVEDLDNIVRQADGLMVARGDLGVEMPLAEVPMVQKRVISLARAAGKPVVVATQMLESMIESATPTRAEVSDVANALYEGTDAVMLSAESAAGAYPVNAVSTMNDIAEAVDQDPHYQRMLVDSRPDGGRISITDDMSDAIAAAARAVAESPQVVAICSFTHSGTTAMRVARERPLVPILAMTPVPRVGRSLCMVWGLHCVVIGQPVALFRDAVYASLCSTEKDGFAILGDKIIVTAGVPFNEPGSTNILRVATIGEHEQWGNVDSGV